MGTLRTRPGGKRFRGEGFGLMELMMALVIAMVVVLALGRLILANQSAWEWGRDKAVLQQDVTQGLEWMARSVRSARHLEITSDTEFKTYDGTGALVHTFSLATVSGQDRLQENGSDLVERNCTSFIVTANNDTTSLNLTLELEDESGNRVAAQTRATVRNRTFIF